MLCPTCQHTNREGRKFCASCGGVLPVPCAACGFANEPGDKFCGGCGQSVAPGAAETPRAPASGERRQVTVLFADLAGYTKLSSTLDPEETHALLEKFFAVVDGTVMQYGGTIDKHIGDNVMAIFGAPVAHGDDPERAVRAAVEMHRRIATLAQEVGIALQVHVGLAMGEVVASSLGSAHHDEYTVIGDSVNLAARLQDKAAAGETIVSGAVRDAAAYAATFELVGDLPLKGIAAPVRAWRITGLPVARAAAATPFVGREHELGVLTAACDAVRAEARGRVFLLRGEPGIGKTRLLGEGRLRAEARGFRHHAALILDFGSGKGYAAARALAESLLGLAAEDPAAARRAAVETSITDGALEPSDGVFLNALLDAGLSPEERRLFDAFDHATREGGLQRASQALVLAAARKTPLALFIEDAHWADRFTMRWLAGLAELTAAFPILLVITSRLTGFSAADLPGTPAETLDLHPLTAADALAFARATGAGDSHVEALVSRAGGNPLFLEQLVVNAREHDGALPSTMQGLMMARVDRLSQQDKTALQAASVAGQRFTLDFVRRLTASPGYDERELLEHQLIKPDGDAYLFQHALMQEAVYATLTKPRRRELHAKAAAAYAGADEVLWAQHLDRADDPGAATAYTQAARAQAGAYLYEEALALTDRGLAIAGGLADRYTLLRLRGRLLLDLGRTGEAADTYLAGLSCASDATERSQCHLAAAGAHRQASRYHEALRCLDDAEAALLDEPAHAERAELHYLRGSIRFSLGEHALTLDLHATALAHARNMGGGEWEARALSGMADAHFAAGRMREASEHFSLCVEACRSLRLDRYSLVNEAMLSMCEFLLGDLDTAEARMRGAQPRAERLRDSMALTLLHMQYAFIRPYRGDYEGALASAERALEYAKKAGSRRFESECLSFLALSLLELGRNSEAYVAAKRSVAISRETGMAFCGPLVLGVLAWATPISEERSRLIAEGEALLGQGTMMINHAGLRDCAIECALEAGDAAEARRHALALRAAVSADILPMQLTAARALAWAGEPGELASARETHETLARRLNANGRLAGIPQRVREQAG